MTTYYKLTDAKDCTHSRMQWGEGVTQKATGTGGLCTDGVIHAYRDPLLAVLMDPIHGCYGTNAHLWEAESTEKPLAEDGTKAGLQSLTTLRRIPLPALSLNVRVRFAIYAARQLPQPTQWKTWAERWCTGADRTSQAAYTATHAAADAARVATYTATYTATHAADAAARATAFANADAAYTAAHAAADAARAAAHAAASAATYTDAAARDAVDLAALAHQTEQDEAMLAATSLEKE